ncbi:MAG: DUF1109 domain-containing protein [Proteobacteria bacterium]|nr:DUF1109 domain-containing protein [Pseudomonadota bacterium]
MSVERTIEALVADLAPVTPLRPRRGLALTLAAAVLACSAVIVVFGLRDDVRALAPEPVVIIRCLLLAVLGCASSHAATQAARPMVGRANNGWAWALAAALTVPAAALLLFMRLMWSGAAAGPGDFDFSLTPWCFGISTSAALLIGGALVLWLRGGAPTNLARAGWLVGLASGAFGTLAYSLHCPSNSIYYVGLVYSATVALCAVLGRLVVPRLIRW